MEKQMYKVGDKVLVAATIYESDIPSADFELYLDKKYVKSAFADEHIYGFVPWRPERGKPAETSEGWKVNVLYIHGGEAYCEVLDNGSTALYNLEDLHAPA